MKKTLVLFLTAILLCSVVLLSSCSTTKTNITKIVKLNSYGVLDTSVLPGIPPDDIQIAKLHNSGDAAIFPVDQEFYLDISIDNNKNSLLFIYDSINKVGRIQVIDKINKKRIVFNNFCDTDTIGVEQLNNLEFINNSNIQEQIVITPIFNNAKSCYLVGYEVRLGTIERGCKSKYIDLCRECLKKNITPISKPDWSKILFGC